MSSSLFGPSVTSLPLFGAPSTAPPFGAPTGGTTGIPQFGAPTTTTGTSSLFGAPSTTAPSTSLFGGPTAPGTTAPPLFGGPTTPSIFGSGSTANIFGGPPASTGPAATPSLFGGGAAATGAAPLFGGASLTPGGMAPSIFGGGGAAAAPPPLFGGSTAATGATPTPGLFASTATSSLFGGGGGGSTAAAVPPFSGFGPATPSTTSGFAPSGVTTSTAPTAPQGPEATFTSLYQKLFPQSPECVLQFTFFDVVPDGQVPNRNDPRYQQSYADNPDPDKFVPATVVGFDQLAARRDSQLRILDNMTRALREADETVEVFEIQRETKIKPRIANCIKTWQEQSNQILNIMCNMEMLRCQRKPLTKEEMDLYARLDKLCRKASSPSLKDRAVAVSLEAHTVDAQDVDIPTLSREKLQQIKSFLEDQQRAIEKLVETVQRDKSTLSVVASNTNTHS
ncbi:nucleoporin Nup44 [Pelomyxa schiedti]|nr:nucleoporin Nup44 [Pelomyxa schiedti]